MSPPYNQGELSLRHLPDTSDASFSFQIPNALTNTDLLLDDNSADFFKDTTFLATPGPSRQPYSPPMTLAAVTPRRKGAHPTPSSPDRASDMPQDITKTPRTLRKRPQRTPSSRSPSKRNLKPITGPAKLPIPLSISQLSPVAESLEKIRAEIGLLMDDDEGNLRPTNTATNGESSSNNVNVTQEDGKNKVSRGQERATPKPTKRTVISGGIKKTRSKSSIPTSTILSRRSSSLPLSQPSPPQTFSRLSPQPALENEAMTPPNFEEDTCSTARCGIAENLFPKTQSFLESNELRPPTQPTPTTHEPQPGVKPGFPLSRASSPASAIPGDPSPSPPRLTFQKPPSPASEPLDILPLHPPLSSDIGNQNHSHEPDNHRHQDQNPFTLSQLSPSKPPSAEKQERRTHEGPLLVLPSPNSSAAGETSERVLVLSPMRPAKKRPSSAADPDPVSGHARVVALNMEEMDADANTDTTGVNSVEIAKDFVQPAPQPRKKTKHEEKGKDRWISTPSAAAPSEQSASSDDADSRNGESAMPQGDEHQPPVPVFVSGSRSETDDTGSNSLSNAKLSSSTGPVAASGSDMPNGSRRPRTTRKGTRGRGRGGAVATRAPAATARRTRSSTKAGLNLSSSSVSGRLPPAASSTLSSADVAGGSASHNFPSAGNQQELVSDALAASAALLQFSSGLGADALSLRDSRNDRDDVCIATGGDDTLMTTEAPESAATTALPASGSTAENLPGQGQDQWQETNRRPISSRNDHAPAAVIKPNTTTGATTKPIAFKFQLDARLEARKAEYEALAKESTAIRASRTRSQSQSGNSSNSKAQAAAAAPSLPGGTRTTSAGSTDLKPSSSSSSSAPSSARNGQPRKENPAPNVTVPVPFAFHTTARAQARGAFDEWAREREKEKEKEEEERRRGREEEEEREIRELRKRAVPKANEVPEWYKDAPKRKRGGV